MRITGSTGVVTEKNYVQRAVSVLKGGGRVGCSLLRRLGGNNKP